MLKDVSELARVWVPWSIEVSIPLAGNCAVTDLSHLSYGDIRAKVSISPKSVVVRYAETISMSWARAAVDLTSPYLSGNKTPRWTEVTISAHSGVVHHAPSLLVKDLIASSDSASCLRVHSGNYSHVT